MFYFSLPLILFLDCFCFYHAQAQDQPPLQVTASKKTYGPDGPWNAVSVEFGNPGQKLDLYPAGVFGSVVFTNKLCKDVSTEPCGSGGLYTPEDSSTLDDTSIKLPYAENGKDGIAGYWSLGAQAIEFSNAKNIMDDLHLSVMDYLHKDSDPTVSHLRTTMYSNGSIVYPNGVRHPPQVGLLALGAPNVNQSFTRDPLPAINASLVPGFLREHKIIPSPSYGLHFGSAALNLPLSLWLGGYDAKRISGQVATFSYANNPSNLFNLDLFDIGIAVADGGSPFSYPKKDGLLASGNATVVNSIPINMNPAAPYLYLPNSTCAAIAKELPVTYNADLGLYFWNVRDPQYTRVVTSPTYLSFTFDNNFIIKVPFKLLNLTLDVPLVPSPTQYFPCQPPQDPASQQYSLGRAFLQAAFIGVDWVPNGQWFLAQAPGPAVGLVPQQLPITGPSIPATPENWANSWKSTWTPLPVTGSSPAAPAATTARSSNQLSGGAIGGIAVGAVAGVTTALVIGFLLYRRRKPDAPSFSTLLPGHKDDKSGQPEDFKEGPPQYATTVEPQELENAPMHLAPAELAGGHRRSELSGVERRQLS